MTTRNPKTTTAWLGTVTSSCLTGLFVFLALAAPGSVLADDPTFARMETEEGEILLVFYSALAPHHVDNFIHLSRTGFFEGSQFHRIVPGFVIQGGDPNSKDADPRNDGMGGPELRDVLTEQEWQMVQQVNQSLASKGYTALPAARVGLKAEFSPERKHLRGSLSMARGPEVDSAGSQFFICVADRPDLDGKYTIFGHVVSGIEVADAIVGAEQNPAAGRQRPTIPVTLTKVTVIAGTDGLTAAEKAAWDAMPAELKSAE